MGLHRLGNKGKWSRNVQIDNFIIKTAGLFTLDDLIVILFDIVTYLFQFLIFSIYGMFHHRLFI